MGHPEVGAPMQQVVLAWAQGTPPSSIGSGWAKVAYMGGVHESAYLFDSFAPRALPISFFHIVAAAAAFDIKHALVGLVTRHYKMEAGGDAA